MIRRLVVLVALLAMPLALLVDGCAAIVGLDESFPLADGGDGGTPRPDATVPDGGTGDAASDATTTEGDGAATDGGNGLADAAPDASGGWRFDDTFGEGGVIALGLSTVPPVIDVDDGGTVRVAYSDGSQNLHLCQSPFMYGGCPYIPSGVPNPPYATGFPVELLSNASTTVLVVNRGTATSMAPIRVSSVAGDSLTYQPSGDCLAVRGVAIDDAGTVTVAGLCGSQYELLSFDPSSTSLAATYDAGPAGLFDTAVRGEGSDFWALGCQDCTDSEGPLSRASYLHAAADGSALANGVVDDMVHDLIASDLLAQPDSGLLVGSYSGVSLGFFTAVVPAVHDGGTSRLPNTFDLGGLPLQPVMNGRTAVVRVDGGVNVIVGAITSVAELALVTVDDQGVIEPPWPQTPQLLPFAFPSVAGVLVGGVATYGGALYVVLEGTIEGASVVGVAKLVHP